MYEGSKDLTEDDMKEMLAIIETKKRLRQAKQNKERTVPVRIAAYGGRGVEYLEVTEEEHRKGQEIAKQILDKRKRDGKK